ncbi:uncharacterized protein LOC111079157 isoform X2 [Drosophila obscura]|uniref:uncharacterized protein LOC111079157 isoform X2 n=1 Tax=Drosophila obscura TaxID=7282 RepID=UPI001BB1F596|nr:uncharacterized protein LOC111079157 isoform X2 [Drosophila obscura]
MTKSKKSKSKSETLIKSSDRSHAVAKGNKKGLTKKSSGKTIPGTSNSVFSTRNSEANPSYHEKTLSIQKYSHESIHRVRSKQHPKSSHLIVPQNHRKVTKKRSHQHANDSNLYSDKVISFVKSSENVQIIDDREDAQDEISQVSLISNLENGFFIDANLSKTFDDHHEHHEHHEHPKTSSHKKASQDSILKKSKLSQESVRIPLIQATESFHINKLKRRPKPVPEIQSETRDDSIISVRTENEPSVLVAENTSQTSDNEDVEVNNNMKFLSQLRDFPNWNEHYKQALLDLTEEVEEDKPEDISVKPGDPLAATSTDLNLAKEDTETDQDGLYEAQPSQLKLCGHSLAEVSTSEIEESDSFDDADDADDADDDDDDLNLSDQFPEEYQAPFKNTNFVLDSDEVDVVVNKLGPFELNGMVYDFLDEIICKVVGIAAKPERILSQILDKDKLMDTLLDEANEHRMEKFIHQNLSKRITDILVRQCKYSLVTPSRSSNMNENNYSRCISALNELDYWLKREKLSIKTARKEVKRLAVEENTMRTEDDNLWQRLEDLINNTVLNRPNASDNLKMNLHSLLEI